MCSEQWKQPFTSTVFLLGVLFGSLFSGQVADRYRKYNCNKRAVNTQPFFGGKVYNESVMESSVRLSIFLNLADLLAQIIKIRQQNISGSLFNYTVLHIIPMSPFLVFIMCSDLIFDLTGLEESLFYLDPLLYKQLPV